MLYSSVSMCPDSGLRDRRWVFVEHIIMCYGLELVCPSTLIFCCKLMSERKSSQQNREGCHLKSFTRSWKIKKTFPSRREKNLNAHIPFFGLFFFLIWNFLRLSIFVLGFSLFIPPFLSKICLSSFHSSPLKSRKMSTT